VNRSPHRIFFAWSRAIGHNANLTVKGAPFFVCGGGDIQKIVESDITHCCPLCVNFLASRLIMWLIYRIFVPKARWLQSMPIQHRPVIKTNGEKLLYIDDFTSDCYI